MNIVFYAMMTLTGFFAMGMLAAVMLSRSSRATSNRVIAVMNGGENLKVARRAPSELPQKFLKTLHTVRGRLGMSEDPRLTARFVAAGLIGSHYVDIYIAARVLGPIAALIAASFIPWHRVFLMTSGAGICYLLPDIILSRLVKRRRERIRLSIPDSVDLLVICVDAGLGLDQAMLRVGHELGKSHPDIQQEFLRINREQRAGKPRLEAWKSMAERNQLQELDSFVNMLAQTERFGTPIARALSNFGDGVRLKRRQRAEELAAKTTVKIIFPLVLFIFPCIFIVLLGPPGINIARAMSAGHM
ncbi:MAG: type II secretion system F family protein [Acidobacteriota bacterium]